MAIIRRSHPHDSQVRTSSISTTPRLYVWPPSGDASIAWAASYVAYREVDPSALATFAPDWSSTWNRPDPPFTRYVAPWGMVATTGAAAFGDPDRSVTGPFLAVRCTDA